MKNHKEYIHKMQSLFRYRMNFLLDANGPISEASEITLENERSSDDATLKQCSESSYKLQKI